jgi:hypothetical protein
LHRSSPFAIPETSYLLGMLGEWAKPHATNHSSITQITCRVSRCGKQLTRTFSRCQTVHCMPTAGGAVTVAASLADSSCSDSSPPSTSHFFDPERLPRRSSKDYLGSNTAVNAGPPTPPAFVLVTPALDARSGVVLIEHAQEWLELNDRVPKSTAHLRQAAGRNG